MRRPRIGSQGFTLVELAVSVAVIAVSVSIASLAIVRVLEGPAIEEAWRARVRTARADAIDHGRPIVVWPDSAHVDRPVLLLPDGRVLGSPESPSARSERQQRSIR